MAQELKQLRVKIFDELSKIVDPEINTTITELELIDEVDIDDNNIKVDLHLTSPFCPAVFGFKICQDIHDNLLKIDIDEPIPTGSITESAEMMEKLADSVIDSATEEMVDISLADMKETPMLEKAIKRMSEKGISIDEMEDMMLDSFKQLDEDGEIRQMLESDPNEMMVDMLMNAASRTETQSSDDDMESMGPIILKSGTFTGIGGHRASGLAKIIDVEGTNYLRFEDFSVTNGPDLRVY